jgi:DNA-directed RNA polymerase specialized sigma24 family protein
MPMTDHPGDAEFIEYTTARLPWLRKVAFLLSSDWHRADDLVQAALIKLYAN